MLLRTTISQVGELSIPFFFLHGSFTRTCRLIGGLTSTLFILFSVLSLLPSTALLTRQTASSPTFSSSSLGPAQDAMFRSISITEEAQCPSLDSTSAALQVPKSKPDTVLFPVVPVQPYPLSTLSLRSRDIADMIPHVRASIHQPQIKCYAGVGKIIYDMLPCPLTPTGLLNPTPASTHAPPLSSTTTASSTPNSRYTTLHAPPPSPSLSDSYARAHPAEVDVTRLDVGLGPSLSVSVSSPSSPQVPGNMHTPGLSPNPQQPPRLVVVNPTPNLSPHPTPPASPLSSSIFDSASPTSTSASSSNDSGGTKGNWLTLPSHHCNRLHDRDRSNDSASVPSVVATDVTTTNINLLSLLQPPPLPPPPPYHQSIGELTSESFVQDPELSSNSNSNRRSISSFVSTTDSATSTITEATSVSIDEMPQMEEHRKLAKDDSRWLDNAAVVGSPADVLVEVDMQPVSKAGETLRLRLDSLSTIHSMSVRKGGDEDEDGESGGLTSDLDTEELDEEMGDGRREETSAHLTHANAASTAAATKKKIGMMKKLKTKTKTLKRNSLKSPTSTLSPPLSAALHQPTSSLTNPQQVLPVPPLARRASNGRSSSRSMSRSRRSSVGIGTNSSASRSRSHEDRGESSLGMTAATRTAIGERKKPLLPVSTKVKNRRFMLGLKGKGGSNGKAVGGGSAMVRRESSGGVEDDGGYEEKEGESERARERMMAMELIQMQRDQQSLIQQRQQQLEMKQREEETRTLAAQLALRDADVNGAEIHRQRQQHHHHEEQQRQEHEIQAGENGLLGVSLKRPVMFNIGFNSDEGSGVGSNSKSGSEISGIEQLIVPIVNGKGKERDDRDAGVLGQEVRQQEQQDASHPHHNEQLKTDKQPERRDAEQMAEYRSEKRGKGRERDHSNPNASSKPRSTSKANNHNIHRPPPKDSTHATLSSLSAKVKHTLSDPLLPGQHKRTIVLTSDSEFEDSADEDGSWSSEEMGSEDDEVGFFSFDVSLFSFF